MAVYTEVTDEELAAFIASYELGELLSFKGIAEGVENSNYIVQTERGRYILTLYEKRVARERPAVLPRADGASRRARRLLPAAGARREGRNAAASSPGGPRRSSPSSKASGCAGRRPPIAPRSGARWRSCTTRGEGFAMRRANALSVAGWRPLYRPLRDRADEIAARPWRRRSRASSTPRSALAARPAAGRDPRRLFPDNVSSSASGCRASSTSISPATTRSPTTSPSASTPGASRRTCRSTSPRGRRLLRGYEECGR